MYSREHKKGRMTYEQGKKKTMGGVWLISSASHWNNLGCVASAYPAHESSGGRYGARI